ncbi:FUSC family protein [Arthrobacter sp. YJM1]|uniref:FUSC family protein n=1 Tax=Arthrobacter horti TaxID=3068273 RepID=A0ABT9IMJ3_9MICC|nr:FUSC family protein [Arthrobacter sp. YJM1]MDP5226780.1 FUSC family protein [Arthrobacter sp. YJM1]
MFSIGPARRDHLPAARVALGLFLPLLILTLTGRLDLAIFANFSAFTGIYGRNEPHRMRLVTQARAGLLMFAVLLAATLVARLSPGGALDPWMSVAATSVVAWACSIIAGLWHLRPAGSLFYIFAFAAVASVPHQPPLWEAMLTSVLVIALCLGIGVLSRVRASHRTPLSWKELARVRRIRVAPAERRMVWVESIGYLVAPALAGWAATSVGQAMGFGHNYWAMVAAVVPLVGHSTRHRVTRGLQRVLGTVVGLGLLWVIVAVRPEAWVMVILIAICQFGAELLIARQYFLAQVCVTPLALLSSLLMARVEPATLLHDRFIDTVIGAAVGLLVVLAPAVFRRLATR